MILLEHIIKGTRTEGLVFTQCTQVYTEHTGDSHPFPPFNSIILPNVAGF